MQLAFNRTHAPLDVLPSIQHTLEVASSGGANPLPQLPTFSAVVDAHKQPTVGPITKTHIFGLQPITQPATPTVLLISTLQQAVAIVASPATNGVSLVQDLLKMTV